MPTRNISIARDFSQYPAGRYASDGAMSGEVFRERVLLPALASNDTVEVNLDQTEGYGSSFLEEAFGGLVRAGWTAKDLLAKLRFVSEEDPTLIDEIVGYIEDAHRKIEH